METCLDQKVILFVRHSGSSRREHYSKLKDMGCTLWCFEKEKIEASSELFSEWIIGDVFNVKKACKTIVNFIQSRTNGIIPDAILTYDEFGCLIASMVCDILNMPGLTHKLVSNCRNKVNFRSFCRDNGIPSVRHLLLNNSTVEEPIQREELSHLKFPVVFKPVSGAGSHFARKISTVEELLRVHKLSQALVQKNPCSSWEWSVDNDENFFFVEEFIVRFHN